MTDNPVGRPTKYNNEILEKAKHYIANYKEFDDVIPQIAGLALELGISRETVYDWAAQEEKKDFSDIVRDLLAGQERKLVNGGVSGDFNSPVTKMMLTKHGYSDKIDNTIASPDGGPVNIAYVGIPTDGKRPTD